MAVRSERTSLCIDLKPTLGAGQDCQGPASAFFCFAEKPISLQTPNLGVYPALKQAKAPCISIEKPLKFDIG
jgi:hypothetical protein